MPGFSKGGIQCRVGIVVSHLQIPNFLCLLSNLTMHCLVMGMLADILRVFCILNSNML